MTAPTTKPRSTRRRPARLDAVAAAAVEAARAAAAEIAGENEVGEHLGVEPDGDRVVTHFFAAEEPGYRGWRWAVTMARVPRARVATVSEVTLLPGVGAVLAPEWVPWNERLRPGDLGVGDLLPAQPDDDRLSPSYLLSDELADEDVIDDLAASLGPVLSVELGLGRPRVMNRSGRAETAQRWYDSAAGPEAPIARAAPGRCYSCGFYLPLAGSLRHVFGACGNLLAPDDGRVVSADHGCGGHSESAASEVRAADQGVRGHVVDDIALDLLSPAWEPTSAGNAAADDAG